jgi:hypothetical protein
MYDGHQDPWTFTTQLRDMDHLFQWHDLLEDRRVRFTKTKLISKVKQFWQSSEQLPAREVSTPILSG